MKRLSAMSLFAAVAFSVSAMTGCGSDNGSGGAADLSLDVSPKDILVGQKSRIDVGLDDINDNGVTLKVRVPNGLNYVEGSGVLGIAGVNVQFEPTAVTTIGPDNYIVFQLPDALLHNNHAADVGFFIEGVARVDDGSVAVDADEFDAGFNPLDPGFDSQIDEGIQVGVERP